MGVTEILRQHDLTEVEAPFLDTQFIHILLKFEATRDVFSAETVRDQDLRVLSSTLLVDELKTAGAPASEISAKEEEIKKKLDASSVSLETAHLLYSAGRYAEAITMLGTVRETATDPTTVSAATWGMYAAYIVSEKYDAAAELIPSLQELVDQKQATDALLQLNTRTWLIHWILFAYFRIEGGTEQLCDTFSQSQYMSSIQASCPWILRYFAASVLVTNINRSRSSQYQRRLKELIRAVTQELYEYTDPVLDFIVAFGVDYDFDSMGKKLKLAAEVLENDYFTSKMASEFVDAARFLIIELFFKVHDRVSVSHLSSILGLSDADTSKLLKTLIADGRLDAEQDSEAADILDSSHSKPTIYQLIKDKTKSLEQRSKQALTQAKSRFESQVIA